MILGAVLGTLVGIFLPLIPGLHMALVLALFIASGLDSITGIPFMVAFVAAAAGSSIYTRRLAGVYHPSAGSGDIASMDPALALTSQGRGPDALRIMLLGTDMAWPVIGFITIILIIVAGLSGGNPLISISQALSLLGIIVTSLWIVQTISRCSSPIVGIITFALIGMLGYTVMHHPTLRGNEHALSPLMSGLFGIPMMLMVLKERSVSELPPQKLSSKIDINYQYSVIGIALGTLSGFFAGMGASSLASMAATEETTHENYLLLSSASESMNDILALLLMMMAGMGRSGEAVLLGRLTGETTMSQALVLMLLVGLAAYIGRNAALKFEPLYEKLIVLFPAWFWAVIVLGLALGQIFLVGHNALALTLTFAGVCLSLWARSCRLPLQISFAGITIPVLLTNMGAAPALNAVLFGI